MKSKLIQDILDKTPFETKIKIINEMGFINLITELGYRENKSWDENNDEDMKILSKLTELAKKHTNEIIEEFVKHKLIH